MKKFFLIISALILLTGCSNSSETMSDKEKLSSEIEYISTQIADLLNNLNNISLENYELVSEKVSISENSSSGGGLGSQGGSSQSSSGSKGGSSSSQSSSGEQSGNSQSSKESEKQNISVTEMQNNSILNVDTDNVDWDTMKQNIELINTSWSIIIIDLNKNNVSNDDITEFSKLLNETILSVKNEDKSKTLINLTSLYDYVPKFLTAISADKHKQNIEHTKSYVYKAYSAASQEDWDTVTTNLSDAETNFLSIVNDEEYSKEKAFKVNKTQILLKDIQNSVSNNDKSLFFLKYKNLIESLNTL